jgi:hypothetical protein
VRPGGIACHLGQSRKCCIRGHMIRPESQWACSPVHASREVRRWSTLELARRRRPRLWRNAARCNTSGQRTVLLERHERDERMEEDGDHGTQAKERSIRNSAR